MTSHKFPLAAFPHWLGPYIEAVAGSLQVPLDMPGAFALGLVAAAAARTGSIRPHGDQIEPLNLFIGLVAPPGQRKSACCSAFFKAVDELERELQDETAGARRAAQLKRERLEQELLEAKRENQWSRVEYLSEDLADLPPNPEPILTTADVTAQKLASMLAEHQCMAVVSAEPSILPTMMGRWTGNKGTTELDVFLQGHSGDPIKVDRRGRPSERVESPRLTLALGLQPEALKSLSSAETAGRGLLARFLWVIAPDVRGLARVRNSTPIPEQCRREFEEGVRDMFRAAPLAAPIRLTPEATDLWVRFADEFELRIGPGGDMRELHGWAEKFRGQVARIAGGLHLADGHRDEPLARDTLERAIHIGQWLEGHALAAFSLMNLRADIREANEILEVVIRNGWSTFTRRQLHQALRDRTRFKLTSALERGLSALQARGWVTTRPPPTSRVGRPSEVFDVDEVVLSEGFEGFEGVSGGLR